MCQSSPFSRFLYSDEVHIGPETVMTTLYTAKKYAVPALEAQCVEFLTKHLRADNAFMLLTQVNTGYIFILSQDQFSYLAIKRPLAKESGLLLAFNLSLARHLKS